MNNEPYGWVKNGEYVLYIEKPDSVFNYIPLYTHPVKELTLTKEEIHAVWASGSYYTLNKDGNIDEFHFKDFARAILRKAQEK